MSADALLVRKDHILCTVCFNAEPISAGNGTPMSALLIAYEGCVRRHTNCAPAPKKAKVKK